ncbi:MAG TPA: DUF1631 domain-containing protein [Gammaproteobacteria bacterium]|nr:DUF1631 domain-containing protein [Gammaproteobacteria bacterium]
MGTDPNIVYFGEAAKGGGAKDPHGRARNLLQGVQDHFVRRATELLAGMLDNTDDALFALADKAENNSVQSMYFDSMREVRLKRQDMETRFRAAILDGFRAVRIHAGNASAAASAEISDWSSDALSLVEHDDLEESLAVSGMISKARARHSEALSPLKARLEHLLGGAKLDEAAGPMDPERLCGSFRHAAQALDLEVRAKLVVYKLFDKHVMDALGELYSQINGMLVDAGVLPLLKIKVIGRNRGGPGLRRLTSPHTTAADALQPGPGAGLQAGGSHGSDGDAFYTLQELLAGYRGGASLTGSGDGSPRMTQAFVAEEVLGALTALQSEHDLSLLEGADTGPGLLNLRAVLGSALAGLPGGASGRVLERADQDIIDIVSMLFDFILDDPSVPDRTKALLARLQIPMVKVAMLDKSFFSSRQHPARQLLNQLAQTTMLATGDAPQIQDELYRNTARAVQRVLQEFESDVTIFEAVLEEFMAATTVSEPASQAVEDAGAPPPRDPVELARERVREEVLQRIGSREIPARVMALLRDAWAEVLTEVLLTDGVDSAAWRNGLEVVDRVLWSIAPKAGYEERKRLIDAIPGLLRGLREGLVRVSVSSKELSAYFQALQECHIECIKDPSAPLPELVPRPALPLPPLSVPAPMVASPAEVPVPVTPRAEADGIAAHDPVSEPRLDEADRSWDAGTVEEIVLQGELEPEEAGTPISPEDDEHLRLVRSLAIGTWMEFVDPDGERIRAKLSARIERAGKYIFVNRAGFKVAEKTLANLVVELRRGTASIMDDSQLFDKALEAVISNLRSARVSA